MDADELSHQENALVATTIREQLARRRISRQRLADEAKISISTLEKALSGSRPFTLATIVRLEAALGTTLRPEKIAAESSVPSSLGSYARASVKWLEGDYVTLRPSLECQHTVYAYRTEIYWDDKSPGLAFREAERLDAPFAQKGVVSVPNKSGHVYLYTNEDGQMRLGILGRPTITGELYGVLATLAAGPGAHLIPVVAPLALIPLMSLPRAIFGRVSDSDPAYSCYHDHINRVVADDFVRFVSC